MALLLGAKHLSSFRSVTSTSQSSSHSQWTRDYAKAAKGKSKPKKGADKLVVKKLRVSRADLRKRSVILTQTVPGVGEIGEELKVARGFARNYLFPNNYAKLASDELRIEYAPHLARIDFDARAHASALQAQKKKIASVSVLLKRHLVPETQKPIALVSKENIIEKLKKQHNIVLKPDQVDLPAPIDRYGKFDIPVKLEDVSTVLKIVIQPR